MPDETRSLVYHTRMIWLAGAGGHIEAVEHGCRTLWEMFWDDDYGGFYWKVGLDGTVADPEKHLYGQAFACFALAKAGKVDDANWVFQWFDLHGHDASNGGYFEALWSEGEPHLIGDEKDAIGTPYGLKSMNTHLHILEALTELYSASKDRKVAQRLHKVLHILRSKFVLPDGRLLYYTTPEYHAASDIDSYGHAMETAFLLVEAAEAVHDQVEATCEIARTIVDRILAVGWDERFGGMFNEGHFDQEPHDKDKIWWVQAESFNVLRMMANRYGSPYDSYRDRQWRFIEDHMIDREHGGWRPKVLEDGTPLQSQNKSDAWTEGYHQGRAILLALQ